MYETPCWTCQGTGERARSTAIVLRGASATVQAPHRCPSCQGRGSHPVGQDRAATR